MPNIHSDYNEARQRYGKSVADAIWHRFENNHGKRGRIRNAVVTETEHNTLSRKPEVDEVHHIINAIVERS